MLSKKGSDSSNDANIAIFVGVPGVGKTKILDQLKQERRVISFGTVMFKEAQKRYSNIQRRDEMRHCLTSEQQRELGILAAHKVRKTAQKYFEEGKLVLP